MARRFAKASEEEIEKAFFYPSDLVNTKTSTRLRAGEERWIYTSTLHYSPPIRGIVVYYIFIPISIYIYNCRQYCYGLLGLISEVLVSGMKVSVLSHLECPTHVVTSQSCQSAQMLKPEPSELNI